MTRTPRPIDAAAAGLLSALLLALGSWIVDAGPPSPRRLAASSLFASLAIASFAICGGLLSREPLGVALGLRGRPFAPAVALVCSLGFIALSICLNALLQALDLREGSTVALVGRVVHGASQPELGLLLLGAALAPGIAEELLFRGYLLRTLEGYYGVAVAATLSTLLFGLIHFDPAHSAAAVGLGAYLVLVRMATGSLLCAIVCHTANNAAALAIGARGMPHHPLIVPLAAALAAATSLWLVAWLRRERAPNSGLGGPG